MDLGAKFDIDLLFSKINIHNSMYLPSNSSLSSIKSMHVINKNLKFCHAKKVHKIREVMEMSSHFSGQLNYTMP